MRRLSSKTGSVPPVTALGTLILDALTQVGRAAVMLVRVLQWIVRGR